MRYLVSASGSISIFLTSTFTEIGAGFDEQITPNFLVSSILSHLTHTNWKNSQKLEDLFQHFEAPLSSFSDAGAFVKSLASLQLLSLFNGLSSFPLDPSLYFFYIQRIKSNNKNSSDCQLKYFLSLLLFPSVGLKNLV